MKVSKFFFGLPVLTLIGCSGGQPAQNSSNNASNQVEEEVVKQNVFQDNLTEKVFIDFFSTDKKLKKDVDFANVSLNDCNYQQLRILKYYPYAVHGMWFKEYDINAFYSQHTDWYEDAVTNLYYPQGRSYDEQYWQTWENDYQKAFDKIQLSEVEKAFIQRVDERISELDKTKFLNVEGLKLGNPDNVINSHQVEALYNGNNLKLKDLLSKYNTAFSTTNCEQLFNIYEENDYQCIPNFVTTDAYLQAFHQYFDYALKSVENNGIIPRLDKFYTAMHDFAFNSSDSENQELYDFVSLYFAIADNQLTGKNLSVKAEQKSIYNSENQLILNAKDEVSPALETRVKFNYSLFKPRGHYTRSEQYKKYFRSMMWLETASFIFSDTKALNRAITMAYVFNHIDQKVKNAMKETDKTLEFLMGESDNFSIIKLSDYVASTYANASLTELLKNSELKSWIEKEFEKINRIQPKVQVTDARKLNFMPQRYTIDGEVLSTMYDETPNSNRPYPKGLDVFDALGFSPASKLLDTLYQDEKNWNEYNKYRSQVKNTFKNYNDWNKSNYNKWLEILINLQNSDKQQPDFMKTSAWGVKNMVTALASWSELKHDAILYAEQPMGAECGGGEDLPQPIVVGYIEPNVKFWSKMLECIDLLTKTLTDCNLLTKELGWATESIQQQVEFCKTISQKELSGEKISDAEYDQLRVIGSTLEYFTLSVLEPGENFASWDLVTGADKRVAVVADVFTRNIPMCDKCGILYEAVGNPNIIYVIVEIQGQLHLTRGATFSHYEFVRELGDRLTDEQWQELLKNKKQPPQPEWFTPLLIDDNVEVNECYIFSSGC